MLRVIFKPVRDSLKRVQSATKDRIKSQKERASVMKVELVTIGNFIENLAQEEEATGPDLRKSFW
jgi:chromodomain-helicase-DNA-binding protein 1